MLNKFQSIITWQLLWLVLLLWFALCSAARAQTATNTEVFNWTAPTTYTTGEPIVGALTYNVYGIAPGASSWQKLTGGLTTTTATITNLAAGTWTFGVTSVDAQGVESASSGTVQLAVTNKPLTANPCTNLTVKQQ